MPRRQLDAKYGAAISQLIDTDFREAIGTDNLLFLNAGVFSADRVKQASYELTLLDGRKLDFSPLDQSHGEPGPAQLELSAYNLVENGQVKAVVLNPWQCCLIRTREQLALPDNLSGKVLARGQLFQKGLIVESTYVDPGFQSSEDRPGVHLMVFNATQRAITITSGTPVARLELFRLDKDVAHPHGGAAAIVQAEEATVEWPWPDELKSAAEETARAREARDRGARLIAMDRQVHALKPLISQVDSLKRANSGYKALAYFVVPWLIWVVLRTLNLPQYLAGDALVKYQDFEAWINAFLFSLLIVVLPASLTALNREARRALIDFFKPKIAGG
jgi:deoxycytidine triphosphate deaminase